MKNVTCATCKNNYGGECTAFDIDIPLGCLDCEEYDFDQTGEQTTVEAMTNTQTQLNMALKSRERYRQALKAPMEDYERVFAEQDLEELNICIKELSGGAL